MVLGEVAARVHALADQLYIIYKPLILPLFNHRLTASVSVADNKIFAKLGSDMKKPDATMLITRQYYKDKVWPLPAEDLLYVGHSTKHKLYQVNILTIGDIASCDSSLLHALLGKWGDVLWSFANVYDKSPVAAPTDEATSIGNSTTTPHDLVDNEDV